MTGSKRRRHRDGATLLKIARVLCHERLLSTVVEPTVADLQREVADAGPRHINRLRAQWRGYRAFWTLMLIAPFTSWALPPAAAAAGAVPNAIARLVAGAIVLALLAVGGPVLVVWAAVLVGAGAPVAMMIHAWYDRHPIHFPTPDEPQGHPPQINFSSTEVAGNIGGLIFVVGSVFIVVLGLPSVIWFLFAATVAGGCLAWGLVSWHASHPNGGLPENLIVLR